MFHSLRLWTGLMILLIGVSAAAQEKPVTTPKPTPEVQKLLDAGQAAMKTYDWTTAIQTLEMARDAAKAAKNTVGEAVALNNLGAAYRSTRQMQKALNCYNQALPLLRQVGDKGSEANVLMNIGIVYRDLSDLQKALDFYGQALPLHQQAGNVGGEANTLTNIGIVYRILGQPRKALEMYGQALPLHKKAGSVLGEATTLTSIGIAYRTLGDAQPALEHYQRAIPLLRQTGNIVMEANAIANLGILYGDLGQPQKALEFYEQAIPLYQKAADSNGEAKVLNNMGIVYRELEQFQKSLEVHLRVVPLHRKSGDKLGEANALMNVGNSYVMLNNLPQALDYQQQALSLFRWLGNPIGEAQALGNIGVAYRTLGQWEKSREYGERAVALCQQIGDKSSEVYAWRVVAMAHDFMGQPQDAIQSYEKSLEVVEQVRGTIGGAAENRQSYQAFVLPIYGRLAQLLVEQNQAERAFAVVGKMKGRTLLEQAGSKAALAGIPKEEQGRLQTLRQKCDKLSLEVIAAAQGKNKAEADALKAELARAERDLNAEQDALFARFPGSAQKNVAQTVALADVPKFLPRDTALLEWVSIEAEGNKQKIDETLLFIVTVAGGKPTLSVHTLPVKQADLAKLTEDLRQACAKPTEDYKPLADKLRALLLPPDVLKRLQGKKRLVICPDKAVWNVPFATLRLPDGKHLIEQFEIDYAYSATGAQASLTTMPHDKYYPRDSSRLMLVLANPDFGDESRFGKTVPKQIAEGIERPLSDPARPLSDPSRLAEIMERGKIKSLPGTKQEADAIHHLYPEAMLLTEAKAQEADLVSQLSKFRYLHFATHGLFSDVSPLQSAIVLAQPPKGSPDDGFLTAREIYALNLKADMAVLSACETARGEVKSGEGVVGLTWALFVAGVPTQVVSQWKVSDASTPELMTAFYGNLKAGQSKGQALRNAALTMMKDGKHSHPYHWAAFVLFGDWR